MVLIAGSAVDSKIDLVVVEDLMADEDSIADSTVAEKSAVAEKTVTKTVVNDNDFPDISNRDLVTIRLFIVWIKLNHLPRPIVRVVCYLLKCNSMHNSDDNLLKRAKETFKHNYTTAANILRSK